MAPAFALHDQDGKPVSLDAYRGRPFVVTFVYSTCEDTCPALVDQVRGALDDTGLSIPMLAVSVDPANDTRGAGEEVPQRAADDRPGAVPARHAGAARAGLEGLRRAAADRAAWSTPPTVVLVDASGRQRVGFPYDQLTPETLAHDLRRLETVSA